MAPCCNLTRSCAFSVVERLVHELYLAGVECGGMCECAFDVSFQCKTAGCKQSQQCVQTVLITGAYMISSGCNRGSSWCKHSQQWGAEAAAGANRSSRLTEALLGRCGMRRMPRMKCWQWLSGQASTAPWAAWSGTWWLPPRPPAKRLHSHQYAASCTKPHSLSSALSTRYSTPNAASSKHD